MYRKCGMIAALLLLSIGTTGCADDVTAVAGPSAALEPTNLREFTKFVVQFHDAAMQHVLNDLKKARITSPAQRCAIAEGSLRRFISEHPTVRVHGPGMASKVSICARAATGAAQPSSLMAYTLNDMEQVFSAEAISYYNAINAEAELAETPYEMEWRMASMTVFNGQLSDLDLGMLSSVVATWTNSTYYWDSNFESWVAAGADPDNTGYNPIAVPGAHLSLMSARIPRWLKVVAAGDAGGAAAGATQYGLGLLVAGATPFGWAALGIAVGTGTAAGSVGAAVACAVYC